MLEAYVDIETTGLSPTHDDITVIGIHITDGSSHTFVQLVGEDVTRNNLLTVLEGVDTLYTYNGSRFDLPFIRAFLGVNLETHFHHCDLMYDCWRKNLYGGFKTVERRLEIPRRLQGVSGYHAVILWFRYKEYGDRNALSLLLEYNREDVLNLKVLRERLTGGDG